MNDSSHTSTISPSPAPPPRNRAERRRQARAMAKPPAQYRSDNTPSRAFRRHDGRGKDA